ncbi:hypothetical protein GLOTRDRAFT_82573 [Gloeophyllum trabeum ATCC 11539]|uniref:TPR-like protein n=1 Tax=Gloeophyllum trabeum (strain ATCC 11539 / FP-39264 / Madison 617) TaxID=670483 RepID=S7PRW2_GLOTA|nr:uncharacterized protein GLOTRDRAFT_82573 [Gloeophyllum trabeum ATCC 11539]EPQ50123.1 hypothetical protein GLOTRDRAFT_82573 [Gloeophyllum trabeum ATCC 11539]
MSSLAAGLKRPPLRSALRRRHAPDVLQRRPPFASCSRRRLSTGDTAGGGQSRISTVFTILLGVGIATTGYGIYQFYQTFTLWPPEVRGDLRAGIKAKRNGDLVLAERYLHRALETAHSLPLSAFAHEPYLKLSGISIALAEVLEANSKPAEAYATYSDALARLQKAIAYSEQLKELVLTGPERLRGVALACKLGEMADAYQQPAEEEERWLTWAVEELLRTLADLRQHRDVQLAAQREEKGKDVQLVLADLDLPRWVTKTDVGAPIEALGAFYAKTGKVDYAMTLYLQAISILMPPAGSGTSASTEDSCRAAQLMSNLSELIMRGAPTPDKLHQAEAWAQQALAVINKTTKTHRGNPEQIAGCEHALAAVLFNLGSLREASAMNNDRAAAKDYFATSLEQSKRMQSKEGVIEATTALRRLERLDRASTKKTSDA